VRSSGGAWRENQRRQAKKMKNRRRVTLRCALARIKNHQSGGVAASGSGNGMKQSAYQQRRRNS